MTPCEEAAFDWLIGRGYDSQDIRSHSKSSPDFETPDGRGWEIKRLTSSNAAVFSLQQIAALRGRGNTDVVFMRAGEAEPVAVVPFGTLPIPGRLARWRLVLVHQPRCAFPFSITDKPLTDLWVTAALESGDSLSFLARVDRSAFAGGPPVIPNRPQEDALVT